tara:strand:- start:590 stop:805 length:216 start_codon:yes stop_codon:yes gene_type:complete
MRKTKQPQIFWAMVDESGYIFPSTVRYLKKDVIQELDKPMDGFWKLLKKDGRKIVKIETKPYVRPDTEQKS